MTCIHISQAQDKINNLIRKINNSDPSVCKEISYMPKDKLKNLLDELSNIGNSAERQNAFDMSFLLGGVLGAKVINIGGFDDSLKGIFNELKVCDCYNEAVRKTTDKLENVYQGKYNKLTSNSVSKETHEEIKRRWEKDVKDYNELIGEHKTLAERAKNLQDKYNDLVDRFNDLDIKHKELKEECNDAKEGLHNEKLKNANEMGNEKLRHKNESSVSDKKIARLEEKLESSNSQVIDLRKRLTGSEDRVLSLENKLDEKSNQLITLRLESGEKDGRLREKEDELERKNEEIKQLKKNLGTTQKTAFDEKIQFKEEKLETLADQLGIELRRIKTLRRRYKELLLAQENKNSTNINSAEDNITAIKEGLQESGINIGNVQRICKKCKKISQLELQLEQPQPTPSNRTNANKKDWKNINSNFTPELVQEWIKHGFTAEQCQGWININPALQQEQAIKEPAYYAWLRDIKKVNAEWVLNQGNERALSLEFFRWYQGQQQQYEARQEQAPHNF